MQISSIASYLTPTAAKSSSASKADGTTTGLEVGSAADNVEQEFLKFAKMSPFDRLRANILNSMGLQESDLKSLSPAELRAVEQKIKELIEQQLHKNPTQTGQLMDVSV